MKGSHTMKTPPRAAPKQAPKSTTKAPSAPPKVAAKVTIPTKSKIVAALSKMMKKG